MNSGRRRREGKEGGAGERFVAVVATSVVGLIKEGIRVGIMVVEELGRGDEDGGGERRDGAGSRVVTAGVETHVVVACNVKCGEGGVRIVSFYLLFSYYQKRKEKRGR